MKYLDFVSGIAVNCLGHSNASIISTIFYPLIDKIKSVEFNNINDLKNKTNDFDKKLLVISANDNVIRLLPPLNVSKDDIDLAINTLSLVFQELQ